MSGARDIEKGETHCGVTGKLKQTARNFRSSKWGRLEHALRANPVYAFVIILATLFTVFGDDFRYAFLPKSADISFALINYACFAIFVVDILASVMFEPKYLRSVISILDFAATISIISNAFIDESGSQGLAIARVGRLVRILRMMRVARFAMVSQEKALQGAEKRRTLARASISTTRASMSTCEPLGLKRRESRARSMSRAAIKGVSAFGSISAKSAPSQHVADSKRSLLGTKLLELITNKIIVLVPLLVLGIQVLEPSTTDQTLASGLRFLHTSAHTFGPDCFSNATTADLGSHYCIETLCCQEYDELVDQFSANLNTHGIRPVLRGLTINGQTLFMTQTSDLRPMERLNVSYLTSWALVDVGPRLKDTSNWQMLQTFIILLILLVFPYAFGRDVLHLAVSPLEAIFDRVQVISTDPFRTFQEGSKSSSKELELINESLHRLTRLLQIGLGHAGTDIITRNLRAGAFSALQAGTRLDAIFCFCNIRNFSDCCDVLQEDCVMFVNTIAAVVARAVSDTNGSVNKNIGEAFLLVWKWLMPGEEMPDSHGQIRSLNMTEAAEACLEASTNIIKRVARNAAIQKYAQCPKIRARLGEDFRVGVGIGLHIGWAIEGAVGSEQKIDATYLSPTVNTTARLESGTRQYGVSLLMSKQFYDLLTHSRDRCRRVDCVAVKGSLEPIALYTYVMSCDARELIENSDKYYNAYIAGDWLDCKEKLDEFLSQWPGDGPGRAIWEYIEEHNFVAPSDWSGYRKLAKK